MKPFPAILIVLAFLLPIGIVFGNHLLKEQSDNKVVTGTLHYFYAPG